MTKEEVEPFVGKFVRIECNYEAKKKIKETQYMNATGYITKLENKFLLFQDNEDNEYLVRLDKIWKPIEDLGERRTMAEAKELEITRLEKEEKAKKKRIIGRL
jgi:glucosamine 6-phosphate synthetase-like amidotransferase/phosphosugar isomerase protein